MLQYAVMASVLCVPAMMRSAMAGIEFDIEDTAAVTLPTSVVPAQTVGGRMLLSMGPAPAYTLSGTVTFSLLELRFPGAFSFGSNSLSFTPIHSQITAQSNGSTVQITFDRLPISLIQPDPDYGYSVELGHWSWTVESAASGRTLYPFIEVNALAFTEGVHHYPIESCVSSAQQYSVIPAPSSAILGIGTIGLVRRRRAVA